MFRLLPPSLPSRLGRLSLTQVILKYETPEGLTLINIEAPIWPIDRL